MPHVATNLVMIALTCPLCQKNYGEWCCGFRGYHEGVYRVAYEFCEDAAKQGIIYSEVRYSPHFLSNSLGVQTYADITDGNYSPRDVVRSVNQALAAGAKQFGITVKSILCCIRHHPGESILV